MIILSSLTAPNLQAFVRLPDRRTLQRSQFLMKDLVKLLEPKYIEVWGKFLPRGGLSIDPYCNYGKPGTDWEKVAWNRMSNHDMFPEKVDNR